MAAEVPDKFEGGVDKQREKLNKMIAWMKEAEERIANLEKGSPLTVCAHNQENTKIVKIKIRDAELIETLGDIDCCCYSGQGGGGPDE